MLLFFADKVFHKDEFQISVTRREVGELLSITTKNTIRAFSEFRKDGLIGIEGKTISLLNKKRLININVSG